MGWGMLAGLGNAAKTIGTDIQTQANTEKMDALAKEKEAASTLMQERIYERARTDKASDRAEDKAWDLQKMEAASNEKKLDRASDERKHKTTSAQLKDYRPNDEKVYDFYVKHMSADEKKMFPDGNPPASYVKNKMSSSSGLWATAARLAKDPMNITPTEMGAVKEAFVAMGGSVEDAPTVTGGSKVRVYDPATGTFK